MITESKKTFLNNLNKINQKIKRLGKNETLDLMVILTRSLENKKPKRSKNIITVGVGNSV